MVAHARDKILDDAVIDIRLEQGETNLPQRLLDVRLGALFRGWLRLL
jgi:hypothetical protein